MFWTIAGLVVTTIISIEGVINSDRRPKFKFMLALITIAGFVTATVASYLDDRDKQTQTTELHAQTTRLDRANAQLDSQRKLLDLVNFTVGDLAILNRLSGTRRYYVQIAADTSKAGLQPFLDAIQNQFPGAKDSGLVSIRARPSKKSNAYILAFGNGLDLAAAEVFERLADNLRFPPTGQYARIESDADAAPLPKTVN